MKNAPKIPAWMKSGRPDTIHKNCLNVKEGLVEACDFDPAMCQECETEECKWHPNKQNKGQAAAEVEDDDLENDSDDLDADEDVESESSEDDGDADEDR